MKGQPTLMTPAEQLLSSHFWTVDWFRRPYFLRRLLGMWQMQLMRFECDKSCKKKKKKFCVRLSVAFSRFSFCETGKLKSFCTSDLKLHLFFSRHLNCLHPSFLGTPRPLATIVLNRRLVWKAYNLKPCHMLAQHRDTWVTTIPQNWCR